MEGNAFLSIWMIYVVVSSKYAKCVITIHLYHDSISLSYLSISENPPEQATQLHRALTELRITQSQPSLM